MFSKSGYETLHRIVFRDGYAGYKPTVKEIPNGDGKVDADKRFAHVAPKYFANGVSPTTEDERVMSYYLGAAFAAAFDAARAAGVPNEFLPDQRYGALRVLDYPPGAVSNAHCDFDLFTLMCYRDRPECFVAHDTSRTRVPGPPTAIDVIRRYNAQAHLGEMGEAIGLGKATLHEVIASPERQCSIVYFAIPDHAQLLPPNTSGTRVLVRDWLNERMARSRTSFKKYE